MHGARVWLTRVSSPYDYWLAPGDEFRLQRGERVFLNFRYLYTPDAFRWLVSRHAGLKIVEEIIDTEARMMTAVCSR